MPPPADARTLPNPKDLQSFLMENNKITSLNGLPGIEYKRDTNGKLVDMNVEYLDKPSLTEIARVINQWTVKLLTDGSSSASAIMQDAGIRPVCYTIADGTFFQEEVHAYVGTTILVHVPEVLPFEDEQSVNIASIYTIMKWLSTLLKKAHTLSVHTRVAIVVHARRSTSDTQHQLSWERNSALAITRQFVAGVQTLDDVLSWKRNEQTGDLQLGKVHMRNIMIVYLSSAMNYAPLKQSILSLHQREVDKELDDVPCPKDDQVRLDCPITLAPIPLRLLMTLNGFGLEDGTTVYKETLCKDYPDEPMPMLVRGAPLGHLVVDWFVSDYILSLLELDSDELKDKDIRYGMLGGDDISRMLAIHHFPKLEKGQPKPAKDQAVDVWSAIEINTSLAAVSSSMVIYNKWEVVATLRSDVPAEAVASPLHNVNHLQAIRLDQLTTVRFDTKVLRLPRVLAFHLPSVLTSSVLPLVQTFGEVILCKPSLAHVSCHEIRFSNEDQVGFVIGAKATLPSGQVTFSSGNPKVDEELEKRWLVYCMMSLNERITAAQQLIGERRLTAHALQTHNGANHNVDRMNEGAGSKRRSMGSVTMRSENFDRANGAESQSPVPPNH